ncbi:MAG TPA: tRNA (adenosine(37)-N6)-threonylcarbamoyltransferase complex ATPase subunit type 1 TsaE [Candidatus Nesterenkonia stercoripullorum]|uniref:tRNA threonylcarbamoyladenosine biosynthesis protein TsaE n=1 Tax=Candidatus Nesterenkonia stercoripullorum TaxID=2838701 RepID=A0A9D1S2T5_9MICC|nr:tRNA (adenosine(37)-N6)-threonylcarbamoyltransferase complex ATPase subunit type 1 TsaE [Candidatus Nesterenkonia stercoripullorum]
MSAVPPPPAGAAWESELVLQDLEQTQELAREVAGILRAGDVLVLTGGLGAGKTTFTVSLADALGVSGAVSSPTFVLSRIHRSTSGGPDLVHVDAYRTDADGLAAVDLISTVAESITVVEWGRGIVEQELAGPHGSWLDLELVIPAAEPETRADDESGSAADAGSDAGDLQAQDALAPEIITDFSETEADLEGTPRVARLRGYGPRFAEIPLPWRGVPRD